MQQTTYKIKGAQFTLIDVKENHGELILQLADGTIYKYYWGAMGCGIVEFIKHCSPDYVVRNLIGTSSCFTFCNKRTFKAVREYIRTEMGLPFYKHMEFQKSIRKELKDFQSKCENANYFITEWDYFVFRLDYNLIDGISQRMHILDEFKAIDEVWHFCETKHSDTYKQLTKLITQLKTKVNAPTHTNDTCATTA